jgi:biotin synthase
MSQGAAMTVERFSRESVREIYERPFMDLVFEAALVHRRHHDPNKVQWSTLLSIKTGACPEDCGYCSQSARNNAELEREALVDVAQVLLAAKAAKASGSTRFCMGAAWREVADRDLPALESMIRAVKGLGLESCMTLGMLTKDQALSLKSSGLDYYNHNLDTSREYYPEVITTRCYDDRLDTLSNVREAGIKVCCGGILGMGEQIQDRIGLLWELVNLEIPPESVPINQLVVIEGTSLAVDGVEPVDPIEFVRTIATARILMPKSYVRLSAGREQMSDELQALCFLAGANSIFAGAELLTTSNPCFDKDRALIHKLGMGIAELSDSPRSDVAPDSNGAQSLATPCG